MPLRKDYHCNEKCQIRTYILIWFGEIFEMIFWCLIYLISLGNVMWRRCKAQAFTLTSLNKRVESIRGRPQMISDFLRLFLTPPPPYIRLSPILDTLPKIWYPILAPPSPSPLICILFYQASNLHDDQIIFICVQLSSIILCAVR